MSVCAAVGLIALWLYANHTSAGQALDARTFHWVAPLNNAGAELAALARRGLPLLAGSAVLALALVAARRGRWRLVLVAGAAVAAVAVIALAARSFLVRPDLGDHGYAYNTFPSVNVAVVAALGLAAVTLWPGKRTWVVAGAAALVAVLAALASVVTYAHRASDVVAALLLVVVLAPTPLRQRAARPATSSRDARRHPRRRPS